MKDSKKVSMPPSTLLSPVPVVMVSCAGKRPGNPSERPNIITLAWVGTINSEPPMLSISIRPSRHSYKLISETKEFVLNFVSDELLKECDYCGVRSGRDEDKFASMKLTAIPAEGMVYAPAIKEAPVSISCKVESVIRLGSHDMFTARIVAVSAESDLFNAKGKLQLDQANLVAFSHGEYYKIGEYLGFFGYSVASKDALARRNRGRKPAEISSDKNKVASSSSRKRSDTARIGSGTSATRKPSAPKASDRPRTSEGSKSYDRPSSSARPRSSGKPDSYHRPKSSSQKDASSQGEKRSYRRKNSSED